MKTLKSFIKIVLLCLCVPGYPQDTITRINGDKYFGSITEIDSTKINFKTYSRGSRVNTYIDREQVDSYTFGDQIKQVEDSSRSNIFMVLAGASFPVGNYASQNVNNQAASFAKIGSAATLLRYIRLFNPYFGLNVSVYYGQNKNNTNSIARMFEEHYGDDWSSYGTEYGIYGAFAGVNGFIPLNKFRVIGTLSAGAVQIQTPTVVASSYDKSLNYLYNTNASQSFAYNLGLGIAYSFSKHFDVVINAEFVSAKFDIPLVNVQLLPTGVLQRYYGGNQTYAVINVTGGLAFNF